MTEYAPQTLHDLFDAITVGSKIMSGIVGDATHTYGYHRGRAYVGPADYSAVLARDRTGDDQAACALDIHLSAADMELVTNRLMTACRNGDPRVTVLREFFGTQNGQRVTGWDRHDPDVAADDGFTTSDDSHLWHIHLSIYRSEVLDRARVLQLAGVINGAHSVTTLGGDQPAQPIQSEEDTEMPIIIFPVGEPELPALLTGDGAQRLQDGATIHALTAAGVKRVAISKRDHTALVKAGRR